MKRKSIVFLFLYIVVVCLFSRGRAEDLEEGGGAGDEQQVIVDAARMVSENVRELETVVDAIELTSRNFGSHIGDGNVWLIEFYSPHCTHCVSFAPTYSDIAHVYNNSPKKRIKVGKINGAQELALVSRFGLYAYPSFYVIDGWSAYEFTRNRSKESLMKFVEGDYKKSAPIPFYSSPMGPIGQLQGLLIGIGITLMDVFQWVQRTFGLSPYLAGMVMCGVFFMGCFLGIVFLALAYNPKVKRD